MDIYSDSYNQNKSKLVNVLDTFLDVLKIEDNTVFNGEINTYNQNTFYILVLCHYLPYISVSISNFYRGSTIEVLKIEYDKDLQTKKYTYKSSPDLYTRFTYNLSKNYIMLLSLEEMDWSRLIKDLKLMLLRVI